MALTFTTTPDVDFDPESLASLPGGEFNDGFQQVVAISFCESPQGLKPDR